MKKYMLYLIVGMALSFLIIGMWDSVPIIKNTVNAVLNPTFGKIINWNTTLGFIIVIAILGFILTLIQKFTTDQASLKELKKEQKILQEEMKKFRDHPEKLLELQKKQFEFIPRTMDLTASSILYTVVPMVLFFKWFGAIFQPVWGNWWLFWYILTFIVFSSIFRKMMNVA